MKRNYFGATRYSYIALRPHQYTPGENHFRMVTLTAYCKQKHISKDQARRFIYKKWLGMRKFKNRIWVHEICPDLIDAWLMS